MSPRKVVVYEYKNLISGGKAALSKILVDNGTFLAFGVDNEELEGGPGHFSTAIVEMPDGSVKNVPVELIVFNN